MIAFCEASAIFVGDERVVKVAWFREREQGLEKAMDVGGWKQVFAAGDVGDLLEGIIDDNCHMVGGADIFAREDDVSEQMRIDIMAAVDEVGEGKGPGIRGGVGSIDAPRGDLAGIESGLPFGDRMVAAGAGVERAFRTLRGSSHAGEF